MKTKNLLLLSLVSLALVGCGETPNSSTKSTKASDAPISSKTSTAPQSTEKKDSATSKDSETSSSGTSTGKGESATSGTATGTTSTSGTETETTSESVSTDIYSTTLWPSSVVDMMLLHLGNRIVPYVDLGKSASKLTASWDNDTDTLEILGGVITGGLTTTKLDTAKEDYEDAGWTVTIKDSALTATNADGDLTVKYYTEDDLCYFTVKYAETFDPTKASSWPADLMSDMNTNMNNHGADVPFVYLGTVSPTGSFSDGSYTIEGGAWDDQITSLAETAFTAANASITEDDQKWTFSTGTNSYGTTFTASVTLADDTVLKVSIEAPYKSSYSTSKRVAKMVIKYKEPFIAPTTGSWPTEISDIFVDFDNHTLPWFYTGGTPTLYSHTAGNSTATIHGATGTWDDRIITLAQQALEADSASEADDANKWVITLDTSYAASTKLTGTRTYTDGCVLTVVVENYSTYSNKAEILLTYKPKFVIPTSGSWSSDITDVFTTEFDGHGIPWFYIGGTATKGSYYSSSKNLTIYGPQNSWDDQVLSLAEAACDAENATETNDANKWVKTTETTYYGTRLIETKTFADGCKIKFSVENNSSYQNKAEIEVYYYPAFTPTTTGSWDSSITDVFTSTFDGHAVPWFYTGASGVVLNYYTAGSTKMTLYGAANNTWDPQILTLAKQACEAENATITDDANKWTFSTTTVSASIGDRLICTRTYADNCKLTFTVENYGASTNKAEIHVTYEKGMVVPSSGSWDTSITDYFTNKFDGHNIPWFYLGGTNTTIYTASSDDYTLKFDADSNTWNSQILDLAKKACEAENATITDDANKWTFTTTNISASYGDRLTCTRTFADGCSLKFTVENWSTYSNYARVCVYYTPNFVYPTGDEAQWSDTVKTNLETLLGTGETIPWIYLGAAKDDVKKTYTGTYEYDFTGGVWSDKMITKAIDELVAANEGWTYIINTYDNQLLAFRTLASGKKVKLILKENSSSKAVLEVYCK